MGGKGLSTEIKKENKARFSSEELNKLFKCNLDFKEKYSINTDSRSIKENEIFLPLIGEKFDGHDFIHGLECISFCARTHLNKVDKKHHDRLIIVENTLDAYHLLANYYRKKINPKVIGITGSSGKTTTKEIVSAVLLGKYKIHKTKANFNNEIGVPKTILEMSEDTEVLVLEMAMRAQGEIRYLSKTAEPNIVIITNVGNAHIGRLGSLENIIKAKSEILLHLNKEGLAILHNDKALLSHAEKVRTGKTKTFDLSLVEEISYMGYKSSFNFKGNKHSINAIGSVYILNSIAAFLVAEELGMNSVQMQEGLNTFSVPKGRGNLIKISENIFLLDESYNANPESVKSTVNNMVYCFPSDFKKILILGELAELGEYEDTLLDDLAKWLSDKPLSSVITIGNSLEKVNIELQKKAKNVKNAEECCTILKSVEPKTLIAVKGSRVAGLDKIVEYLEKNNIA